MNFVVDITVLSDYIGRKVDTKEFVRLSDAQTHLWGFVATQPNDGRFTPVHPGEVIRRVGGRTTGEWVATLRRLS